MCFVFQSSFHSKSWKAILVLEIVDVLTYFHAVRVPTSAQTLSPHFLEVKWDMCQGALSVFLYMSLSHPKADIFQPITAPSLGIHYGYQQPGRSWTFTRLWFHRFEQLAFLKLAFRSVATPFERRTQPCAMTPAISYFLLLAGLHPWQTTNALCQNLPSSPLKIDSEICFEYCSLNLTTFNLEKMSFGFYFPTINSSSSLAFPHHVCFRGWRYLYDVSLPLKLPGCHHEGT